MSYILDALRKADAQRVRDPAQGIHAQPTVATATAAASAAGSATRARREPLVWGAAAVMMLLAAAWLWTEGRDDAPAPGVARVVASPPVAILPQPTRGHAAPAAAVLPGPPPPIVVAPVQVAPEVRAASVMPTPMQSSAPAPAPAAPLPADRIYTVAELPPEVQQAWPKLSISGGVYSENVAQRMLIVNGQVFNEGSEIAPGVVLQQLRAKTAVLKFRGLTISQPY